MPRKEERRPRNADDAEWAARLRKRLLIVQTIKQTAEYQSPWRVSGVPLPVTPDYRDRSCSKRKWEGKVHFWRLEIQKHRQVSKPPLSDITAW